MKIELNKFGSTLVSRDAGKEALAAIRPTLDNLKQDEIIEVSFEGVISLTPSWASEFLEGLIQLFNDRVILLRTDNPAVVTTLEFLEGINKRPINMHPSRRIDSNYIAP